MEMQDPSFAVRGKEDAPSGQGRGLRRGRSLTFWACGSEFGSDHVAGPGLWHAGKARHLGPVAAMGRWGEERVLGIVDASGVGSEADHVNSVQSVARNTPCIHG